MDDDGAIMAYDAAITLQHSVGLDPLPDLDPLPWEPWRDSTANVDGAGAITAYDAGIILQYSAGIISSFSMAASKSGEAAEISIQVKEKQIIFYSHGKLLGLNVFANNGHDLLGEPVVLGERLLSAFKQTETSYKIGLCTAYPPEEGMAILRIPFRESGMVDLTLLVNGEEDKRSLDLNTGISEVSKKDFSIYPNPADKRLYIDAGVYGGKDGFMVKIFSSTGVTLLETMLNEGQHEIDLSDWPARGMYIVQISHAGGALITGQKIVVQ